MSPEPSCTDNPGQPYHPNPALLQQEEDAAGRGLSKTQLSQVVNGLTCQPSQCLEPPP